MSAALAPVDRDRLARLLGMLGSDHLGEVANAGRLADKLVRAAGLTWHDILSPAANDRRFPERNPPWRATVAECLRRPGSLRRWEHSFLDSLTGFPRLSAKQRNCLDLIAQRVLGRAAA
jgi:hypothetical protein